MRGGAEFIGNDPAQRGLAETGRSMQKHMVQSTASVFGRFERDPKLLHQFRLSKVVGQLLGTNRWFSALVVWGQLRRDDAFFRHGRDGIGQYEDRRPKGRRSVDFNLGRDQFAKISDRECLRWSERGKSGRNRTYRCSSCRPQTWFVCAKDQRGTVQLLLLGNDSPIGLFAFRTKRFGVGVTKEGGQFDSQEPLK